tara:strand:- start:500 stop:919 length:420 start_codon:yes stop_codon:yes gene_type:complete
MTREEVWKQAQKQHGVASVSDKECNSYIFKGIKIMKCNGVYRIFNTKMKGDFYQEITEEQYIHFEIHGFEFGVYNIMTDNLHNSLIKITNKIQLEINIRNNTRHYNSLKEMRAKVLKKLLDANNHKEKLTNNGKNKISI